MRYAEQRIPALNEYCVVCDERHVFQNGPMLKVHTMKPGGGLVANRSEARLQIQLAADRFSLFCFVCVSSQQFAPGSYVCFPFIHWGLCLELQTRLPPVQRLVTHIFTGSLDFL